MSKAEILAELPHLSPADRDELLRRLCELQDNDLLDGSAPPPTPAERALLDAELAAFRQDNDPGIPWRTVLRDIRTSKP